MPIVSPPAAAKPQRLNIESTPAAWTVLSWLGVAFIVMGMTDVALGWYPASFGNAEWEFGAISAALNGLALPTLGLYLVLAGTIARRQVILGKVLAVALVLLALGIGALAVLYVTDVPLALNSVAADPMLTAGMKKAIIKGSLLLVAYTTLFVAGASRAWRVS